MPEPLVSVIMPAYNAANFIAESISSVLLQTYTHWELIVIDDGSTDGTAKIIKSFLYDPRVEYIYQENGRQGKAKNTGIKASKGEYIAFLDADDLWMKDKLKLSLKEFNGTCDLVFTDSYCFEEKYQEGLPLKTMGVGATTYQGKEGIVMFLDYNRIPNLTVIVKRGALIQAGDFTDKIVAEEYEMWLRLLANGCRFKSIDIPLSLYRMHHQSITAKDRHATFEIIGIIKEFGSQHPEYATDVTAVLKRKVIYWLYNGAHKTAANFRKLISGVYEPPVGLLLYLLSFLLGLGVLKKIVVRIP